MPRVSPCEPLCARLWDGVACVPAKALSNQRCGVCGRCVKRPGEYRSGDRCFPPGHVPFRRLPPDIIDRMDSWLKADNCRSRNEFVEKALRFYMGYLGTEDNTAYLSQAILTAIQGTLDDNNNRLCRILFKCAVELNMLCHTIAAHFRTDPIHTRELRAYAVDEVKRTNGQVSFESAVHQQRRIEPDDTWPGSY